MTSNQVGKLALVWRGDLETRRQATPANNRWHQIFAALAALNIDAEPAIYCEEAADEVRDQLLKMDGVLVWVDPLSDGRTRFELDALLREIASRGISVSTHPDVTQKMGVKEVLYTTRHLGWGTDTRLYRSFGAFRDELIPQYSTRQRTTEDLVHQYGSYLEERFDVWRETAEWLVVKRRAATAASAGAISGVISRFGGAHSPPHSADADRH